MKYTNLTAYRSVDNTINIIQDAESIVGVKRNMIVLTDKQAAQILGKLPDFIRAAPAKKKVSVKKTPSSFVKPTVQQVLDYCLERENTVDANKFIDHYESNGWKVGKNSMKNWKAAVRTWERGDSTQAIKKPRAFGT